MLITTTETVPGKEITEILGVCRGSTVRARNVRFMTSTIVQGASEILAYGTAVKIA